MRAYINLKTNIPDLIVDYVELTDKNGKVYNFNPSGSSDWDLEDGRYFTEWRGVDNGEEDASGCLGEIPDNCRISTVGVYSYLEESDALFIREMEFTLSDKADGAMVEKSWSIADVMPVVDYT